MNLIEQFGGYEQANNKLLKMDKILKEVYYSPSDAQKANELRQTLLDYRRQHNIFEAGDDVVCDNFDETIKVINLYEGRLVIDTGIKTTPDSENTMVMALPAEMFRHATPEEIKAGKRLEVKSDS